MDQHTLVLASTVAMQITIKTLTGRKSDYTFDETATIEEVKSLLMEKEGIDKKQLRLIFKGKQLNNEQTLTDAKVNAGDIIHMVLSLRG